MNCPDKQLLLDLVDSEIEKGLASEVMGHIRSCNKCKEQFRQILTVYNALGETVDELKAVFADLSNVGVNYLTIGQYLAPTQNHHPIEKYYEPSEFDSLADSARLVGIKSVLSAPLVRSSYHAKETFHFQ